MSEWSRGNNNKKHNILLFFTAQRRNSGGNKEFFACYNSLTLLCAATLFANAGVPCVFDTSLIYYHVYCGAVQIFIIGGVC